MPQTGTNQRYLQSDPTGHKSYGYETVELIREYYPATPLLALTGMGGPYMTGDIIQTLMNKGADNVVSKDILCDSRMLAIVSELLS